MSILVLMMRPVEEVCESKGFRLQEEKILGVLIKHSKIHTFLEYEVDEKQ